jgi:hypothetical protein
MLLAGPFNRVQPLRSSFWGKNETNCRSDNYPASIPASFAGNFTPIPKNKIVQVDCTPSCLARLTSTLPLWLTIGSTAVVTANSASALIPANVPEYFAVTSGQVLNFISTSTSTGYVCLTEMT